MAYTHRDYTVACICPMGVELAPVRAMLDDLHPTLPTLRNQNAYVLGRIGQHNVVLAVMPETGNNAAAIVATQLVNDFPAVRFGLLVGIGGGVPGDEDDETHDVRLGDVVVSHAAGTAGGVVQYDLGKWLSDRRFERTGHLNKPPPALRSAVQMLRAQHDMERSQISVFLNEMLQKYPKMKDKYAMPDAKLYPDHLFLTSYIHQTGKTCAQCDLDQIRLRAYREDREPVIHYGNIGSANAVLKDAMLRDGLKDDMDILCVEMEAAGIMDSFPCLVIRGICDYADSHKNKKWQPYAAAVAAAYMKELLMSMTVHLVLHTASATEALVEEHKTQQLLSQSVKIQEQTLHRAQERSLLRETQYRTREEEQCHRIFKTTNYEQQKDRNPYRIDGTCRWVLDHWLFRRWCDEERQNILWISADPGCGKSVLAKSLIDYDLRHENGRPMTKCYFFFKDTGDQDSLDLALSSILHQLFDQQPHLLRHAVAFHKKDGDKIQRENQTLWRILQTALMDTSAEPTFCIVDALDECKLDDQRQLIEWLRELYAQTSSTSPTIPKLKFLITSRPYDTIQRWFKLIPETMPLIRLRGENENEQIHKEINLVVDHKITELVEEFSLSYQSQKQLQEKLRTMQHRTYLWLYLSMETIRDAFRNSLDPETAEIDSLLPSGVEDAYEKILQRVQPAQKALVHRILLIIVGARRALSINEMAVALNIYIGRNKHTSGIKSVSQAHLTRHIRDWCGLFVYIEDARIHLIHQTAKEFLIANEVNLESCPLAIPGPWKWSLHKGLLEREMASLCIEYLCRLPNKDLFDPQLKFFDYCAQHWLWHCQDDHLVEDESLLNRVLTLYDSDGQLFHLWFPIMWKAYEPFRSAPNMLAQHLAAYRGHIHILSILQYKPNFDIEARDDRARTVLWWAVEQGHLDVIQMLLNKNADVNVKDAYGDTPLCKALSRGNVAVACMMLDNDANVNVQNAYGRTALWSASDKGFVTLARILIDANANMDLPDVYGTTAICQASLQGHTEMVQMLLKNGADLCTGRSQGGGVGNNPLVAAVGMGRTEIVRLLLDGNINIDEQDFYGETALFKASEKNFTVLLQMLLDKNANANIRNRQGHTALDIAIRKYQPEATLLLLQAGATYYSTWAHEALGDDSFASSYAELATEPASINYDKIELQ